MGGCLYGWLVEDRTLVWLVLRCSFVIWFDLWMRCLKNGLIISWTLKTRNISFKRSDPFKPSTIKWDISRWAIATTHPPFPPPVPLGLIKPEMFLPVCVNKRLTMQLLFCLPSSNDHLFGNGTTWKVSFYKILLGGCRIFCSKSLFFIDFEDLAMRVEILKMTAIIRDVVILW